MAHSRSQNRYFSGGFAAKLTNLITAGAGLCGQQLRDARTRRVLASLTSDQLADIGRDPISTPVIPVKPGLITTLMSMR